MSVHEPKITFSDRILAATLLKLIPKRVTPNQVTIFRFFSVPFIVFLLLIKEYFLGTVFFAIAAFSDAVDGSLARTRNQVTDWGKTYDPIADKLLIGLTAILIVPQYLGDTLIFLLILIEMILIGAAYYVKNKGLREIQANIWGKIKMMCQSLGVGLLFLNNLVSVALFITLAQYLLYAAIFFAIISLVTYGI